MNIPLPTSDHPAMTKFIQKKVVNGGAIPGCHRLQEKYFYLQEKEALKTNFSKKLVAVILDKPPDVEGRCVLNILIAPLEKDESGRILAYLADTVFLEQCNHSTVSMAVIGGAFQRPFDQLNSFMLSFSQMFFNAGSHKRRHLQFMTRNLPSGRKATTAPNPCATRWDSWLTAVQYHSEHFGLYKEFIEKEIDASGIPFADNAALQIYISNIHFNSTKDIQTDTYTEKYTKR